MVFRPLFAVLAIILLFLVPFITMRLMAEEKRSGTAELLVHLSVDGLGGDRGQIRRRLPDLSHFAGLYRLLSPWSLA